MKRFMFIGMGLLIYFMALAQGESTSPSGIPDGIVSSLDGEKISSKDMSNNGNPFIICFWKSCCSSTLKFMDALHDIYPDLVDDFDVKVYAISVDDSRSSSKVKPLIYGKGWEFDVLLDVNEDFKRAMNVNLTPHYFIYDGNRNLVWQKIGFAEGDEYLIEDVLVKMENGESVE